MKKNQSAGILLYRLAPAGLEVFLVHPGGPFFKNKDAGSWTIPKGEFTENEEALQAALREFEEETGYRPSSPFLPLKPVQQKGGKRVYAWAASGNLDPARLTSNEFSIEWPPRSGKQQVFPEVDRGEWFSIPDAAQKINPAQSPLLEELANSTLVQR